MRSALNVLLAGVVLTVAGCSADDATSSAAASSAPATTTPAPGTTAPGIAVVEVFDKVQYYGACGDETVDVGGTTLYPLLPDDRDRIDETDYPLPAGGSTSSTGAGLDRVVPPGPSDDIGTMVVYTDGTARFQSESGRVLWLTDEEQTYYGVC